jgi:hypothetical protein
MTLVFERASEIFVTIFWSQNGDLFHSESENTLKGLVKQPSSGVTSVSVSKTQ